MDKESIIPFNFWPSLADLMLILVLVLIVAIFVLGIEKAAETIDIATVRKNQMHIINSIATECSFGITEMEKGRTYGLCMEGHNCPDVVIRNDVTMQRILFSEYMLFDINKSDMADLKVEGRKLLRSLAQLLCHKKEMIQEIQIHGHTDNTRPDGIPDPIGYNMNLGAYRAITVFRFFQDSVEINPIDFVISATTFGEYVPVSRNIYAPAYTLDSLLEHNSTQSVRDQNRRIELLLFYRN